ncbi:hypothetical protein ACJ41O_001971 [Fusarium nematophilum]
MGPRGAPLGGAATTGARSLGTMAMAQQEKRFDSDSSSDAESARQPWFPPPPTAPVRMKRVQVREAPRPVDDLPALPPMPPVPPSPSFVDDGPRSPLLERVKSKRRTIMERIEGWWDLELLEKRRTLFGGGSGSRTGQV